MEENNNNNNKTCETLKFLCSYNGTILPPRLADGKLRYAGGLTRVLAVERSITFAELMVKIGEFCGFSATLKCQLPNGDLETLITVTSDEDLANLIEEYRRLSPSSKIRAVLSPKKSVKTVSPPPSVAQSVDSFSPPPTARFFVPRRPPPVRFQTGAPPRVPGFAKPVVAMVANGPYRSARVLNHHLPRSFYWQ